MNKKTWQFHALANKNEVKMCRNVLSLDYSFNKVISVVRKSVQMEAVYIAIFRISLASL